MSNKVSNSNKKRKNTNFSFTSTRLRKWSLITYLPLQDVQIVCDSLPNIRYYAFAYHDKDLKEDGTPKEPHFHVLLVLKDARTAQSICKHFIDEDKNAGNCPCEPLLYLKKGYEYLYHKNEDGVVKPHYSPDIVVSNAKNYFVADGNDDKDNVLDILEDINNRVSIRKLISTYGRDFVFHYDQYKCMALLLLDEDIKARERLEADKRKYEEFVQDKLPF